MSPRQEKMNTSPPALTYTEKAVSMVILLARTETLYH